jgi:hypothetical protein
MNDETQGPFHFFKTLPLPLKVLFGVVDVLILVGLLYYFV